MRLYEVVLVVRPSVKEADRKKLFDLVKGWLKDDAKITKQEEWGQKPLAYPIKKEQAGYYVQWFLESENGVPTDFEQRINRNNDIIRHLMLRTK